MVEIGNEDFFDNSGSYNAYRYPMFANAIRQAYPQLKLIATTPVTNGPVDIVDEHYYSNDPPFFAENAHLFDSVSRTGPKVIVGEFATTNGTPTGTLANAVGEAAFLTGMERNADLVLGRVLCAVTGQRQRAELADQPHRLQRTQELRVAFVLGTGDALQPTR